MKFVTVSMLVAAASAYCEEGMKLTIYKDSECKEVEAEHVVTQ